MVAPAKKTYLRAGELARAAGVSADTLHHYERKGVLAAPRRSANGYREYPFEALARVRLVRRALGIGFTLDELARILRARDRGHAPCREVRALAASKLADVEERLRELISVREELRAVVFEWDARLAKTPAGSRAGLLDALAVSEPSGKSQAHAPAWRRRKAKKGKTRSRDEREERKDEKS
jgi:DNA-binding transcriptional MerR regulator